MIADRIMIVKTFDQLSLHELYALLRLRAEVFIVEQKCPYQDLDGKDLTAWHLWIQDQKGQMLAYSRLLAPGISYPDCPSIGRVLTHVSVRHSGLGKRIFQHALDLSCKLFPHADIKISAQSYLVHFYAHFGFKPLGQEYLEDGIPHVCMFRPGISH